MLNLNGLTRYLKKSKTWNWYKELETCKMLINFLVFFAMMLNNESSVKFNMSWEWHLMIMHFFKDQKAEQKGKCLAEISRLWKISPLNNFLQVTVNLDLF